MTVQRGEKFVWQLPTSSDEQAVLLGAQHNIPIPIIQTLLARGVDTHEKITDFLFTPEHAHVTPACQLMDAQKAVARIKQALDTQEKILIAGDYDVDGMSATALMMTCLLPLTKHVNYFLPHRVHDGYGLAVGTITKAAHSGYSLVITVDNGITAIRAAHAAREHNIDLIITDHHEPQEALPDALAILNPLRTGCAYPFKSLAGVGVAFKLMSLLYSELGLILPDKVYELLMLGTVADMVPLLGENRYWVRYGLAQTRQNISPALALLKQNARLAPEKELDAGDIGFFIAPQLNALGRLQDPRQAVVFLMSNNKEQLAPIAQLLAELNESRKTIERSITAQIDELIKQKKIDLERERVIFAADAQWPTGVIGLVASRLVAEYGRPAVLFHLTNDSIAKGSGRSIEQFNLFNALTNTSGLLDHFGGHACAAGLTLHAEKLPALKQALESFAAQTLKLEDLTPKITIDAHAHLADFNGNFIDSLAYLSPFGMLNKEPVFCVKHVSLVQAPLLLKGAHVKCKIFAGGVIKPVIFFNRPELFAWFEKQQDTPFDIAAQVTQNYWQGMKTVELRGVDVACEKTK